ncbi:MAG: hypothetical protein A3I75_03525 [Deltaproteobacteria bacterium RIFCSPLOWO2_02_FULL_50_16]|nr:MAG: hypothetical protein A2053_01895 [Deltaproteobacteria bacterium GWA2_50_8]OGQ28998.1 MAG: hypothetical protein A3B79_04490 [Deltaproteobacteria bacterium RIFCSPHIGHO2_02_FULL_50_15]OGQ55615.1 MAG: hypothetical protein A3I75_03525 [Deltaproteobacteria bacterium RIFCSPLOWO2_02_FULL_50_16]OGQ68381.1 MAG: hypothetical protein A3F89_07560 [Deltaproteobacteria bacterium RIFCSPLOWO2_12_FULL_50_11]
MMPHYHEPLFRPPSEASSLIFQVTLGCSWNQCAFCEMYTTKKFRARPFDEIETEIRAAALTYPKTEKVFLADGDALVLNNKKLIPILHLLYEKFPHLKRVSSYALPKNLLVKSVNDLKEVQKAGLTLIYYGVETGDPFLLKKINKGTSREEMMEGMTRAHEAGLILSTTNLLGLGGRKYSKQHALNTADLLSKTHPQYISFLTLMFPLGKGRFLSAFGGDYEELNTQELLQELKQVIENLHVRDSEFRSNHASNHLALKAHLPEDKNKLLKTIHRVLQDSTSSLLRPEYLRGL